MRGSVLKKSSLFAAFLLICIMTASAVAALAAAAEAAVAQTPASSLSIQRLVFVEEIMGLAQYKPHPGGSSFTQDEKCTVYVEVGGFSMPLVEDSQDEYGFSLAVDAAIKAPDGEVLAFQSGIDEQEGVAYSQLPLHYLAFSFNLEGWTKGDYVLEVGVRDNLSDRIVSGDLPLSVGAAAAP